MPLSCVMCASRLSCSNLPFAGSANCDTPSNGGGGGGGGGGGASGQQRTDMRGGTGVAIGIIAAVALFLTVTIGIAVLYCKHRRRVLLIVKFTYPWRDLTLQSAWQTMRAQRFNAWMTHFLAGTGGHVSIHCLFKFVHSVVCLFACLFACLLACLLACSSGL
jgi:hypothetical protein